MLLIDVWRNVLIAVEVELADESIELLTMEEAAAILRVNRVTLYRLLSQRKIASIKIGHSRRISRRALSQYIQSQTTEATHNGVDL